jgi:hypothetical protein
MYLFKFKSEDIFTNSLVATPSEEFFLNSGVWYYNNTNRQSGSFSETIVAPSGNISLLELNIDRPTGGKIIQFLNAEDAFSSLTGIGVPTGTFDDAEPGDPLYMTLPYTASLSRNYFTGDTRPFVHSLLNTFNYYTNISPHYSFSSSLGDKSTQDINIISIPSIFYGSRIRKKSVELNVYRSGVLTAQLKDSKGNGELVQVLPTGSANGSGSVAGVVLYSEGFISLTGSWSMSAISDKFEGGSDLDFKWKYFAAGASGNGPKRRSINKESDKLTALTNAKPDYFNGTSGFSVITGTTFNLKFKGQTETQVVTMLARAPRGKLNFSNNPSYIDIDTRNTSSYAAERVFSEDVNRKIKNIVSASYTDTTASFEKTTYISKIALYDENENIIGVARMAQPTKKLESRDFTFKLKLDI